MIDDDTVELDTPLRVRTYRDLRDALRDAMSCDDLALIPQVEIRYDPHDRLSFVVEWYEARTTQYGRRKTEA